MSTHSTPKATEFAKIICNELKIIEGLNYIRLDAIDELEGTYGEFEEGTGDEEYGKIWLYSYGKFSSWFNKHLNESQKQKLLELSKQDGSFEIEIHSTGRRNLILSFFVQLKRTNADEMAHLNVTLDFPDIDSNEHTIYGEMLNNIAEDEISKMLMIFELKR
jgi:hypothetical protein